MTDEVSIPARENKMGCMTPIQGSAFPTLADPPPPLPLFSVFTRLLIKDVLLLQGQTDRQTNVNVFGLELVMETGYDDRHVGSCRTPPVQFQPNEISNFLVGEAG